MKSIFVTLLTTSVLASCGVKSTDSDTKLAVSGSKRFSELKINTQQGLFILTSSLLKLPFKFSSREAAAKAVGFISELDRSSIDTFTNGAYTISYFKNVVLTDDLLIDLSCVEGLPAEAVVDGSRVLKVGPQRVAQLGADRLFGTNFISELKSDGDNRSCIIKGDTSGLFVTGKLAPRPTPTPEITPTPQVVVTPKAKEEPVDEPTSVRLRSDYPYVVHGSYVILSWKFEGLQSCDLHSDNGILERHVRNSDNLRVTITEPNHFWLRCQNEKTGYPLQSEKVYVYVNLAPDNPNTQCPPGQVRRALGGCSPSGL